MDTALFYANEILLAGDLQQGFANVNQSHVAYRQAVDFPAAAVILSGGQISVTSPASSCVQMAPIIAIQNGQLLTTSQPIQINILGSACAYGTGQAAGSQPRIDVVCIQWQSVETLSLIHI